MTLAHQSEAQAEVLEQAELLIEKWVENDCFTNFLKLPSTSFANRPAIPACY